MDVSLVQNGQRMYTSLPRPGQEWILVIADPDFSITFHVHQDPEQQAISAPQSYDVTEQIAQLIDAGRASHPNVPDSLDVSPEDENVEFGRLEYVGKFPQVLSVMIPGHTRPITTFNEHEALEFLSRGITALLDSVS